MSFRLTHEQMESWIRDQQFLKHTTMENYLQSQECVTCRQMNEFVTRLMGKIVPEQVQTRQAGKELYECTLMLNIEFDEKVASSGSLFDAVMPR